MIDFEDIFKRGKTNMKIPEIACLYDTAMQIEAKNILEIGSCYGTSSMTLASVTKTTGGMVQSIEPMPKPEWYLNMGELGLTKYCTMITGYSPWVDDRIINTPIDYLLIDGEHRPRWCLADYHYWSPYVRIGGRIAFHDYVDIGVAGKGVMRSVAIILEDDSKVLREIGRVISPVSGLIVFEKLGGSPYTPQLGGIS